MTPLALQHRDSVAAPIVIDCSQTLNSTDDTSLDSLLHWVRSYPDRRAVHIYLGAQRHRPHGRKIQNALQAMGCMVTNRMVVA